MRRLIAACAAFVFFFGVSGCTSVNPAFQALGAAVFPGQPLVDRLIQQGSFRLEFAHLHVTPPGQDPVMVVLGYVDEHPQGPVQVWYAPNGPVIKTQNGRVVGLFGLPEAFEQKTWSQPLEQWPSMGQVLSGVRTWDAPAQYRYGTKEAITLVAVTPSEVPRFIKNHLERRLSSPDTSSWVWVRQHGTITGNAWFALASVQGQQRVAYSYQCLGDDFCLHLAPWPVLQGGPP